MHTTDDEMPRDGDVSGEQQAHTAPLDGHSNEDQPEDAENYDLDELSDDEPVDGDTADRAGEPARRRRRLPMLAAALGGLALLALGGAGGFVLAQRSSDPVVATVNGDKIHRSEYDRAVAQSSGAQVIDDLVVERLIEAEAKKRGISVSNEQLAKLRDEQRANFDSEAAFQAALARAGITDQELSRQLRLNEIVRQLVADQTQVTDQEIADRYTATKDQYPGQTLDQVKDKVKTDLVQEKTQNAVPALVQQLKANAKIETHVPGASS